MSNPTKPKATEKIKETAPKATDAAPTDAAPPIRPKTAALTMPSDPLAILSMQNLDRHFRMPETVLPLPEPTRETDSLTSRQQDSLKDSNLDDKPTRWIEVLPESKMDRQIDSQPSVQTADKTESKMGSLTDSQTERQADSKPEDKPAARTARKPAGRSPAPDPPSDIDPLDWALLQKLGRPYPELAREKFTLVSSRLPDDLVERLGYAADLVKKHRKSKQDILARGLILAFEELVESDGAVEWYEK